MNIEAIVLGSTYLVDSLERAQDERCSLNTQYGRRPSLQVSVGILHTCHFRYTSIRGQRSDAFALFGGLRLAECQFLQDLMNVFGAFIPKWADFAIEHLRHGKAQGSKLLPKQPADGFAPSRCDRENLLQLYSL